MENANPYKVKVLEKTLRILDLFDEKGKELTPTEIGESLKLNKSSVFRIVNILTEAGYLEKNVANAKYRLGFKLYYLGSLVQGGSEIRNIARPFLEELKNQCDETVHLVVLDQGEALYLDKLEGEKAIRVVSKVGWRLPAHCSGVGKVLLAFLSDKEVTRIIHARGLKRFTNNTITDIEALRAELSRIRKLGYAIDNEEIEVGLKCVAAPLMCSKDEAIAAISISGPLGRFSSTDLKRLVPLVKSVSVKISDVLKKKHQDHEVLKN